VGIPTESPYPQNPQILHTNTPHPLFSLDAYLLCYSVYSVMIMQQKLKSAIKTNSKFGSIRQNSNIDHDIYRIFNAFPLNLTSIQKSPQNSRRPVGIRQSPHTHPIPISMGIPIGISIPTAANCDQTLSYSRLSLPYSSVLSANDKYLCIVPYSCLWSSQCFIKNTHCCPKTQV